MNFKVKEVLAKTTDGDAGKCDSVSAAPATVPKKRGRFSNSDKPKNLSSRGDGEIANTKTTKLAIAEGSKDGRTSSDDASPLSGSNIEETSVVSCERPSRGKLKLTQTIIATRKGSDRPNKSTKTDLYDHKTAKKANNKRAFTILQYTTEDRERIIKAYYENGCSRRSAYRALRKYFGVHNRPSEPTISKLVQKFERTGSVCNIKKSQRARRGRSDKNIDRVRESVADEPDTSIRRRSQQLGLSYSTTRRILTKDLQNITSQQH